MGELSSIEWTTHTFNPWIGCAKVSAGCTNCYAEAYAKRYGRAEWGVNAPRVRTSDANWRKPHTWNRAAKKAGRRDRVFCASLADVFEDRPELTPWRAHLFDVIAATPHLDWLLLTKRPENVMRFVPARCFERLPNIWIGTSVEDQEAADTRIPHLLGIPAAVRFLSMEPLLGLVDLRRNIGGTRWIGGQRGCDGTHRGVGTPECPREPHHHHDDLCGRGIDWVIVGGESGPKARPMHPDWARDIRDQCVAAGVPFFFKQWGEFAPRFTVDPVTLGIGEGMFRVGKKAAGRMLDGREWNEMPTFATAAV